MQNNLNSDGAPGWGRGAEGEVPCRVTRTARGRLSRKGYGFEEPSGGLFARAFNVLPGSSEYGPANCFRIDAIHLGDLVVVKALLPQTDKIQHVIGSEFCCWIRAAVRSIGPTLSGHIG